MADLVARLQHSYERCVLRRHSVAGHILEFTFRVIQCFHGVVKEMVTCSHSVCMCGRPRYQV